MRKILVILMSVSALIFSGCMSMQSGTKVENEQLQKFVKGKTTYDDVIKALGKPTATQESNKEMIAIYSYSNMSSSQSAASYIPIVGLFAGGPTSQMDTQDVTFTFDRRTKILKDYTKGQSSSQTKMNPFSLSK